MVLSKPDYCNFEPHQSRIHGLNCEKWSLKELKVVSMREAIGHHIKESIFHCFKCNRPWKIVEQFDSHHGYARKSVKLGESVKFGDLSITFHQHEMDNL